MTGDRYRIWEVFTQSFEGVTDEINRLHREHGWKPISFSYAYNLGPVFVVLFDTTPE